MKFTLKAKKKGRGVVFNGEELHKGIEEIPEGTTLLITVTDQRSVDQNALLHVYLTEISNHTGESLDDLKSYFKHMFLGYIVHTIHIDCEDCPTCVDGRVTREECPQCEGKGKLNCDKVQEVKELRSTTSLTIKEFIQFTTQIESWAWTNLQMTLNKGMYGY